jgi:hypothetical protein
MNCLEAEFEQSQNAAEQEQGERPWRERSSSSEEDERGEEDYSSTGFQRGFSP